jgi:hypothetical protein
MRREGNQTGADEAARTSTCLKWQRLEREPRFVHGPYLIDLQTLQTQKKVGRAFRGLRLSKWVYGVKC